MNGTSFLSGLNRFWIKRRQEKPVILNENLIAVSPEHWIKYFFPTFIYIVLMAGGLSLFYAAILNASTDAGTFYTLFIVSISLVFITHHWFFWFILAESQAHIIVTSRRVVHVHEVLLFHEEMVKVSFERVKTVEVHKDNILQSVLNYGTLVFEGRGAIQRVPHPGTIARQIEQAMGMI